jgi:uroporphyrinogen decarboxylase
MTISHRSRLETTLCGQKPDRIPVSLWRHFPVDDQAPETLAAAVVRFQETFDFDFVKITPASTFCLKDWGMNDSWQGNPEGTRQITNHAIKSEKDWQKLKPLNPRKGFLHDQLTCVQLVRKALDEGTPVIQTIFSPLSQAKNLVGKENLVAHLRMYPDLVKDALQTITESTIRFINECIPLKIDGIFYAVQQAQYSLLNEKEFLEFGKYFDGQILESIKPLWLNVGHIHGKDIMFERLSEYPVRVLNWHDRETPPNLKVGKEMYSGVVCGGLMQWETLAYGTPDLVEKEALDAIRQTGGRRFILGTGCVTPIIAPDANIFAARKAVERI